MRTSTSSILLSLLAVGGIVAFATVPTLSKTTTGGTVSFTSAQVASGDKLYQTNCAACHGVQLEGGAGPALAGPNAKTLRTKLHATVSDIFTIMAMQMPFNAPASLKHDQYVAIAAYILSKNGWKPGSKPLTYGIAMNSKAPLSPRE